MSKVIVAGSINMDIVAYAKRYPEVGETVEGSDLKYFFGGKGANQAVSAARLGAKTVFIGKVGSDASGNELTDFLKEEGITLSISQVPAVPTGTALITISAETGDNTIVVVAGANSLLTPDDLGKVLIEKGDVLVSQFEIPIETIEVFFKNGRAVGATTILNPAPAKMISSELLALVDILILNETELALISEMPVDSANKTSVSDAVKKIKNENQTVIVTLGEKGALLFTHKAMEILGKKVKALDTTGAGDCFVGAVAAEIARDADISKAVIFANVAASISVTRQGASSSMPKREEVSL